MKRIFIFLACFLFVVLAPSFGRSQDPSGFGGPLFDAPLGLGGVYGMGDNFGTPDAQGEQVVFSAKIVPAERSYGKSEEGKSYAWLVVEAVIRSDSYIYSITQKSGGGLPSEISIPEGPFALAGPVFTSTEPKIINDELFTVPLEEHFERAVWFAPLSYDGEKIPADATLKGTIGGQVCIGGPFGSCLMFEETFTALLDPDFEIAPIIAASEKIAPELGGFVLESKPKPTFDLQKVTPEEHSKVDSLFRAILYGFFGGLILNVMPCVLPVIGLKILSFFEQAGKSRVLAFKLNLVYSLGLLSVFLVIATLGVGLNTMYANSWFNLLMVCIVFVMSLSLMGLWEVRVPSFIGGGKSAELMQKEGYAGAFFKGIITTLLAIPCSAPLLGAAVAWTSKQPPVNVYIIFTSVGLGMASPYLLVGAFPELLRFFPKPGAWMETFKNAMGFALLIAVIWILYYIQLTLLMPTIAILFSLWFACWMIGRIPYGTSAKKHIVPWAVSLGVVLLMIIAAFGVPGIPNKYNLKAAMEARLETITRAEVNAALFEAAINQNEKPKIDLEGDYWSEYSLEKISLGLEEGRIVMVDFTADWCTTCKAFEAFVLHNEKLLQKVDERNILTLKADITHGGQTEAMRLIEQIGGGKSIPIVAVFFPENPNHPAILRGGNTVETLLNVIEAGPKSTETESNQEPGA